MDIHEVFPAYFLVLPIGKAPYLILFFPPLALIKQFLISQSAKMYYTCLHYF